METIGTAIAWGFYVLVFVGLYWAAVRDNRLPDDEQLRKQQNERMERRSGR